MPSKAKNCDQPGPSEASAKAGLPEIYYPLHSLLHTLRTLDAHSDRLCTLLTDIQRSGKVSSGVRRELAGVLHELPSAAMLSELQAVWSALEAV